MAKKKKVKANKEYELLPCKRKHDWRILSTDPGTRNFGIACIGVKNNKIDVIASSILTNPISILTSGHSAQRDLYIAELMRWINLYSPDAYIAERFQTRGNGGPTIELVSTMNALLPTMVPKPYKYIVASQWKNDFNKRWVDSDYDDYDTPLKALYDRCLTAPHQLDGSLIGVYGLEQALDQRLVYDLRTIVEQVEATSLMKLRKRK